MTGFFFLAPSHSQKHVRTITLSRAKFLLSKFLVNSDNGLLASTTDTYTVAARDCMVCRVHKPYCQFKKKIKMKNYKARCDS